MTGGVSSRRKSWAGIYFEILRRIERKGYDVFSARVRVPRPQRAVIALRLWLKALLGIQNATFKMQGER